jgi:maltooligosyltrehalose trehalohydrolase
VREGRHRFVRQFPSIASGEMQPVLHAPEAPEPFKACKLDGSEFGRRPEAVALHRDLLRLRREDPVSAAQQSRALDGAVLGPEAFFLRCFGQDGDDRLLLVNFGRDLDRRSIPDPLFAPPEGCTWVVLWSSEHPAYDGTGTPPIETDTGWRIPGHAAVVMRA